MLVSVSIITRCSSIQPFCAAAIFNVHVQGYNRANPKTAARVYVDPDGEKVSGGLIVAKKVTSRQCHEKYG